MLCRDPQCALSSFDQSAHLFRLFSKLWNGSRQAFQSALEAFHRLHGGLQITSPLSFAVRAISRIATPPFV
jgi:hypothetical protein